MNTKDARLSGKSVLIFEKREGVRVRYKDAQGFVGYTEFMEWSQLPAISVCESCGGRGNFPDYDSEDNRIILCGTCEGKGYK